MQEDPYEGSAQWLREVGKRPVPPRPAKPRSMEIPRPPYARPASRARGLMLSCALSLAFLQYYFLDVMVQIESLPEIVIFVGAPASA